MRRKARTRAFHRGVSLATCHLVTGPAGRKPRGTRSGKGPSAFRPVKEARYTKSFTRFVGGVEVYAPAEALDADRRPLVRGKIVTYLSKYDTTPSRPNVAGNRTVFLARNSTAVCHAFEKPTASRPITGRPFS